MLIRNEHKPYMAYKKEEKIQPALKSNYRLPTLFGAISAVFVGLIGYSFFVQEKYHQELSWSVRFASLRCAALLWIGTARYWP